MSNYNQYYYKGDTINARVSEDGMALDLTDDKFRQKLYLDNYRLGVAKQLNSIYKRTFGRDSGISDSSVSLEILGHAAAYDFSEGLNGKVYTTNPVIRLVGGKIIKSEPVQNFRQDIYNSAKEANIGIYDDERKYLDAFGKIIY